MKTLLFISAFFFYPYNFLTVSNGRNYYAKAAVTQRAVIDKIATVDDEMINDLPDDLNTSKVIFLRYDSTEINGTTEKAKNLQKKHNKQVQDANKEWAKAAKNYPFEYIIASRKDISDLKAKGYKYVLDSPLFKYMMQGIRQDESSSSTITVFEYQLYFWDSAKTTGYLVTDEFHENHLYFPSYIMNSLVLKKVKKKFK